MTLLCSLHIGAFHLGGRYIQRDRATGFPGSNPEHPPLGGHGVSLGARIIASANLVADPLILQDPHSQRLIHPKVSVQTAGVDRAHTSMISFSLSSMT